RQFPNYINLPKQNQNPNGAQPGGPGAYPAPPGAIPLPPTPTPGGMPDQMVTTPPPEKKSGGKLSKKTERMLVYPLLLIAVILQLYPPSFVSCCLGNLLSGSTGLSVAAGLLKSAG